MPPHLHPPSTIHLLRASLPPALPLLHHRHLHTTSPANTSSSSSSSFNTSQTAQNPTKQPPPITTKPTASPTATTSTSSTVTQTQSQPHKTQSQLDEEIRLKMAGLAGDGGEAGVELEDGQPVAMKRGVRSNMFRYI